MLSAQVVGGKSLIAKLRVLSVGIVRGGNDAARIIADQVAEYAEDFAPEDTSALKMSIRVEETNFGYQVHADRFGDSPEVAIFLEYGTSKMAPRPFMQPAVDLVLSSNTVGVTIRTTGGLLARGV